MNKETLLSLLNTHTSNHRLDLPIDSLQSPSVTQQFDAFLASENFILDPVTNQQENGNTISFTGTGGNALFKGMTLTAQFTAGDPVQLVLTAQGGANWKLYNSLPTLQYTLGEALLFDNARLQLASQTIATISTGLWFNGKLNLSSSLGLFLFLIGSTESVFAGQITTLQDGVPIMQLNTSVRSGTNLEFFSLGPITLRLISQAQPPLRDETLAQPRIFFEFTSSIQFTAKGQPRSIPLVASIYNAATSIRVDADLTQGIDAALDEIKALTNSIGLNTLSFGDFKLENIIKLTQLTLYVNPSASTKLTNVALRLKSAKSWDLLKTPSGQPLLRLQEISVTVGLRSPFSVANLSAYLEGRIQIGGGLLILSVAASSSQDITLRGYLDSYSQVTLSDLMHYFLHDSSDRTPSLRIYEFDILVQPSHHYELWASVTDLWSITLSNQKTFSLDSVELRLSYTSANQQTNALMSCFLGIGGAALSMTATYSTTGGWDVKGGLAEGQSIELGNVLADLEYGFEVELPEFLYEIRLDTLSIHFNTTQKVFDFVIGGGLPVEDGWLEVVITVHVQQVADSQGNKHYEFTLSGIAKIAEFQFKLIFLHNSTSNYFLATYYHSQEARSIAVRQLIGNISSNIAQYVPKNIKIDLKDALFAYSKATEGSKFLFGLDISANINLSNLPLVGKEFPPNQTVGVDDLQLLFASKLFDQTDLDAFTPLIPEGVTPLPQLKNPDLTSTGTQQSSIKAGLNVAAQIKFGNTTETLALPVSGTTPPNPDPNQPSPPPSPNTSVSDNTKWFTLQKTFGPVHFERVGIQYQDAALWFLLDAALSAAGLTLSLDGLSIGSPLTKFDPKFNLKGIGIDYRSSSALEIGGAFLRKEIEKDGKKYEEYDGTAIIKTEELTISAIGSYTELNGHPSLFIYATLDYPIGGPAFFFVTGLAAGFGYNRTLKLPPIEQIAQFPLIQEAIRQTPPFPASVGGQGGLGQPDITQKLESLKQYIPPATGEIFLAVGIRFTSFKIIDSFALLTIAFGNRLELNLLGISTLIAPPEAGQTPLAEVQLALKATFIPADGILQVQAQLTPNSYLFSRNCHLTGGFAFYTWFSNNPHTGDFILTLGGYHPNYQIPTHYPQVPRLGFNWQVDNHLTLKGDAYYALTPSALMAGGHLQATWESSNIKAWFNAGADFLIAWKPYHYQAHIYVDIGATYQSFLGPITVDVGADLQIWGPEFSGKAQIHYWIISVEVSFGNRTSQQPQPIDWNTFKNSFLPHDDQICSITVKDGLVTKPTQNKSDLGVINPKHFSLITNSVIPSKQANLRSQNQPVSFSEANTNFGIGSMDIKSNQLTSIHTITIKKDGQLLQEDHFDYIPIYKNVPTGLWGESLKPDLNQNGFIKQTLSGFEIKPKNQPESGHTQAINRKDLQYEIEPPNDAYKWLNFQPFTAETLDDKARREKIKTSIEQNPARNNVLAALGFDKPTIETIKPNPSLADNFLVAPKVGA